MLKNVTNTIITNCNSTELTYNEYILLENTQIPIRAKLNDDCYNNGNFIGSFIFKTIQFETNNEYNFKNKEFVYYKVVNGESIKIGTFITTEIQNNDTNEIVKVTAMDYGLKTQIKYISGLDYANGEVTLLDVWNEACELSGLQSGVSEFTNSNFIVDSDQFTGTGALIRDVFVGIALSSGNFIKVMNDDKIYPIFKTHTEDLLSKTINTTGTIENVLEMSNIQLNGSTVSGNKATGIQNISIYKKNLLKNTNVNSGDNNCWKEYSTYDETTGTLTRSTTAVTESFITHRINGIKSNTTYTISCLAKSNGYVKNMDIYCYNTNTQGIKTLRNINLTTSYKKYTFTFTTDSNVDYSVNTAIRFDNNGSTTDGTEAILTVKNVMLVEGTDDDYEKYNGIDYQVNLGSIELGQGDYIFKNTPDNSNYDSNLIIDNWYLYQNNTTTLIENTELINQLNRIKLKNGLNNIYIYSSNTILSAKIDYYNNNSEIIEDYTDLEDKRDTQPISCVRLGLSNIDGENVDLIDDDLVAEYGQNWLILNDNPFAYNQSKREQLITAIFNKVKGFGYSSFTSKTSFKPYLTCGDTIKYKNKNGDLINSILLRYNHEYKENDIQITLEAPSETSAEVNYIHPLTAVDLSKKTQIEVDRENVKITSLTEQTLLMQNNLNNNYYTIEQSNQLIQESATGLTNTFSEAGGNNIFRNTGLWFESGDNNNPYEFWNGNVLKNSNDKAVNNSSLLLQNNTLYQEQTVSNGNYTVSFKYKKLIELANVSVKINDVEYELTETTDTEFQQAIEINSQFINVQFISDTNNSCEIYDLMVNSGNVKLAYSQNQNETTTDTVNISKGITITSSDNENTVFKANADGVRIYEKSNMSTPKTKFTDKGTETNYLKVEDEAVVVDILIQKVGSQTWLTKI